MMLRFSLKEYNPEVDRLVTMQDMLPARLICDDLRGSSFPCVFLIQEDEREKIILANSSGITGSRSRKYDIGMIREDKNAQQ